jgi:hypothetical protein
MGPHDLRELALGMSRQINNTRLLGWNPGHRLIGLFRVLTAIWLMYCAYAITTDLALGAKAWI